MLTIISRTALSLVTALLQVSFLPVVFPQHQIPNIAILLCISWTILVGFEKIWPAIIVLGIFVDLVSFSIVGRNVIFLIAISYFVSFFSRRFLVENRKWGRLVVIFFVIFSTFIYSIFNVLIFTGGEIQEKIALIRSNDSILSNFLIQSIFSVILFYLMFHLLERLEEYLRFRENNVKISR